MEYKMPRSAVRENKDEIPSETLVSVQTARPRRYLAGVYVTPYVTAVEISLRATTISY